MLFFAALAAGILPFNGQEAIKAELEGKQLDPKSVNIVQLLKMLLSKLVHNLLSRSADAICNVPGYPWTIVIILLSMFAALLFACRSTRKFAQSRRDLKECD